MSRYDAMVIVSILGLLTVFFLVGYDEGIRKANAQGKTPWTNTQPSKFFRVSVTSYREDYTWDIEAPDVVEARKKVFATLKRLYGGAWTTKSGKVVLYEK